MRTAPKIIFLITKSNFGGAQKYVYELALAAHARGWLVTVACGGTGKKKAEMGLLAIKLREAEIPVVPINNFMRDMSANNDLFALIDVWRLLRDERPDILHVTSSKAGGIGALAGRITGVPKIIFTSHGLTIDEVWRPLWQRIFIFIGTWFTITLAHCSIMISTETYKRIRHTLGLRKKVVLIKNGIAPVDFMTKEVAQKELELDLPPGHFLIGGIGELHPNKNWSVAITTLASLPTHLHLAIIGGGEEYESLKEQSQKLGVADRVHLLGYVPDADCYLKAFDLFMLPSKKEGLPYVLLEAGLAGLPVIASDLPGNRDIIESGTHGFLVEPTKKMLSISIEMLLRDEGMRRRMGAALQEKVMAEFSITHMNEATFELYGSSKSLAT